MRALATHPERRYATASDFADDLRRYLDGRPIRARPDSAWYRMRKFAARHRSGVAIASSALVALVIGLAVALAQARRANVERDRALAARDFLLGHMTILSAVTFKQIPGAFSDACNKAIENGKPRIFRDDWLGVFDPAEIAESIRRIT